MRSLHATLCGKGLATALCTSASAILLSACVEMESHEALRPTLRVSDFGALPDDGKDDAKALRLAFQASSERHAKSLVFAPGRYDLHPDGEDLLTPLATAQGLRDIELEGCGAELVYHDCLRPGLTFKNCANVIMRDFKIDSAADLHTAGRVVATGEGFFDLAVDPAYEAKTGLQAREVWECDGEAKAPPLRKFKSIFRLEQGPEPRTLVVAPGVMRVQLAPDARVAASDAVDASPLPKTGSSVIVFHVKRRAAALRFMESENGTFENVSIYACPGMAFASVMSKDISLRKVAVEPRPGSGRWLSSRADGLHFMSCRGRVLLESCRVEKAGDDGFAIHGMYGKASRGESDREIVVKEGRPGRFDLELAPDLRRGDRFELGWGDNPMLPKAVNKVEEIRFLGDRWIVRCESPLPPEAPNDGVLINNVETLPSLEMRRCEARESFACGLRLKTRRALVEDCVFERCYAYGLLIECDEDKWYESASVDEVEVRGCSFRSCGAGNSPEGSIKIVAGRKTLYPEVHRRMAFRGNSIDAGGLGHGASVFSSTELLWEGNIFSGVLDEAIYVDYSSKAIFKDNRLVGETAKSLLRLGKRVAADEALETGTMRTP